MEFYDVNYSDFYAAIHHLNSPKFPSKYTSLVNLNSSEKYYAIPKDYATSLIEAAKKYFDVASEDRDEINSVATLPSVESAVGIADENNNLKTELIEGTDYILISKRNKEMIDKLYGYLTDPSNLAISPSLPKVYIHKGENGIEKETVPVSIDLSISIKTVNDTTIPINKQLTLSRYTTTQQTEQKIRKIIDAEQIESITGFVDITLMDGDNEITLESSLNTLLSSTQQNPKLTAVVVEKKTQIYSEMEPIDYTPMSTTSPTEKISQPDSTSTSNHSYHYNSYERKGTKGVCGLQNLGNTCFMNSSIQCLIHTKPLVEFFFNNNWQNQINKDNPLGTGGKLANAWSELVKKYWDEKACISPANFKQEVGQFAPQFRGFQQHDSQELMSFVLDGLHEDLNRVIKKPYVEMPDYDGEEESQWAKDEWERYKLRNDSIITDSFTGQFKSRVICKVCGRINLRFDPYVFLSVGIPRKQKIISVCVYDQNYKKLKKTKTDSTNKSIKEIIADVIEDADSSKDPNNYVMVAFGYGKKIDRIVTETPLPIDCEYGVVEKQQFVDDVKVVDVLFAYSNWKDVRLPVVVDATLSNVEIEKIIAKLFVESNIFEKKSESKTASNEQTDKTKSTPDSEKDNKGNNGNEDETIKENKDDGTMEFDNSNLTEEHNTQMEECIKEDNENKPNTQMEEDPAPLTQNTQTNMEEVKKESTTEEPNSMIMEEVYEPFFEINDSNEILTAIGIQKRIYRYVIEGYNYYSNSRSSIGDETVSLYDCLNAFEEEEDMDGNNTVYCSHCKEHQLSKKKMDIWSTNKVLIVHLKRFGNSSGYSRDKISTLVEFPINNLDMRNYVRQYDPNYPPIYNLYAVSNHSGSLGGGHYVASARVHTNNKWYDFNDSSTSETTGDPKNIVSKSAYVLYYIRSDVDVTTEEIDSFVAQTSNCMEEDSKV
ncbi:Ubiquitin carboxyl-terminal hydrolase [Entamoeba marina]